MAGTLADDGPDEGGALGDFVIFMFF